MPNFHLNDQVGTAEEAHQRPHDQRIGVDHAQNVKGHDVGKEIWEDVNGARERADRDLDICSGFTKGGSSWSSRCGSRPPLRSLP